MVFLAMPEDQAELLCQLQQEHPVRAILEPMGATPPGEEYVEISIGNAEELTGLLRSQHVMPDGASSRLHLREADLPGDFVWDPDLGLQLHKSLAVAFWPSALGGNRLFTGNVGIASRQWYDHAGADQSVPKRLKARVERMLRRLCKLRAAPVYMVAELAKGTRPRGLTALTVHVSEGAADLKRRGGRWLHCLQPNIEYELLVRDGQ
jgi:hypothetical protein